MQIANIAITDSAAASVTFSPLEKDGLFVKYGNVAESDHALREKLTLGMRPANGKTVRKVSGKVTVPYGVLNADGSTTYKSVTGIVDFLVPEDAPQAAIDDCELFVVGLVNDGQVQDAIENGAFPY